MSDERNRIAEHTVGEAGNRDRFHQGNNPQILPLDLTEEEQATLDLHRASLRVPGSKPRWGTDEHGEPIEVGPQGLIVTDPLTGAVEPLTEASAARSEKIHARRAEQAEARYAAGAPGAPVPPLPAELTATASGSPRSGSERPPSERPAPERASTQRGKDS